jgi:ferritin-like metal-binding protein YciE
MTKKTVDKMTPKSEQENTAGQSQTTTQTQSKDLHSLLEEGLKDIYSAEKLLVEALPEMAQAADNEELEEAITFHLEQTKKQVTRLDKVMERLGVSKTNVPKCEAMEGLIQEGRKVIREFERGPVRDSALIIGAQKIEHYEIASYGSLCELADVLEDDRTHEILSRTLDEEEETDAILSDIAQNVNDEALELSESNR